MLRLAWPVILAELGWMSMQIVDTIIVGPLGPAAIGAVGTGSNIFFAVIFLGMGTLLALDTFVAQNFGAGRVDECHRWLFAGIQLALLMSVILVAASLVGLTFLPSAHLHPQVMALLMPYLRSLLWSVPPLMLYMVFRRYLQAMNIVRPITITLLTANIINALVAWVLVYGRAGFPALGVVGSAYATLAARIYLAGMLWAVIVWRERRRPSGLHDVSFRWDGGRMRDLVRLGMPAAGQGVLEIGVFATAGALAARISPIAVAANQIVLNIAAFVFMIPFGLSSAAAVRVGQAVGRGDPHGVRRAGWAAIGLALASAITMSTLFVTVPTPLLKVFTTDGEVLSVGITLLLLCALFQPFDGFQVVSTGALRGLGDTRTPMVVNLFGHWLIGLPVAYYLCFRRGWGVVGLWSGLSFGLILIGGTLLAVWHRRTREVNHA